MAPEENGPDHETQMSVSNDAFEQAIAAAEQADRAGKYADSLVHSIRALELQPDDRKALLNKASALSNLDRNPEALQAVEALLQKNPAYSPALWIRGTILRKLGRLDDSLTTLDQAIQLDPQPTYYLEKSNTLVVAGRSQEAIAALDKVVEVGSQDEKDAQLVVTALQAKAHLFRANGQPDIAEELEGIAAQVTQALSEGNGQAPQVRKRGCAGSAAATVLLLCLGVSQAVTTLPQSVSADFGRRLVSVPSIRLAKKVTGSIPAASNSGAPDTTSLTVMSSRYHQAGSFQASAGVFGAWRDL